MGPTEGYILAYRERGGWGEGGGEGGEGTWWRGRGRGGNVVEGEREGRERGGGGEGGEGTWWRGRGRGRKCEGEGGEGM